MQIRLVSYLDKDEIIYIKKSRYVTKASLRHITANDEASSLSGDFIIAHHSPAKVLTFKKMKFYICSDGTHTHLAYSEA
jgi:hypothetical protein